MPGKGEKLMYKNTCHHIFKKALEPGPAAAREADPPAKARAVWPAEAEAVVATAAVAPTRRRRAIPLRARRQHGPSTSRWSRAASAVSTRLDSKWLWASSYVQMMRRDNGVAHTA